MVETDSPLLECFEERLYQFWPSGRAESLPLALAAAAECWTALQLARHPAELRPVQTLVQPCHTGGFIWSIRVEERYTSQGHIPPHYDQMMADPAHGWAPHPTDDRDDGEWVDPDPYDDGDQP